MHTGSGAPRSGGSLLGTCNRAHVPGPICEERCVSASARPPLPGSAVKEGRRRKSLAHPEWQTVPFEHQPIQHILAERVDAKTQARAAFSLVGFSMLLPL